MGHENIELNQEKVPAENGEPEIDVIEPKELGREETVGPETPADDAEGIDLETLGLSGEIPEGEEIKEGEE